MAAEGSDLGCAHRIRVLLVVKMDVAPSPVYAGLLGTIRIVVHSQNRAESIQQFRFVRCRLLIHIYEDSSNALAASIYRQEWSIFGNNVADRR